MASLDDGGTGAVVVGRAEQLCQHQNQHAARRNALRWALGEKQSLGAVCTATRRRRCLAAKRPSTMTRIRFSGVASAPACSTKASRAHGPICPLIKTPSSAESRQGEQCGVLHRADIHDLKRKDGGSQRRAEDGRERTRHAAHRHQAAVVVFQMQRLADLLPGHTAAQQQRRALAAAGTAEQMGHDGGRRISGAVRRVRGLCSRTDTKTWLVEPPPSGSKMLDTKYDDKARRRQQINQQPRAVRDGVGPVQSQPERRPNGPTTQPTSAASASHLAQTKADTRRHCEDDA